MQAERAQPPGHDEAAALELAVGVASSGAVVGLQRQRGLVGVTSDGSVKEVQKGRHSGPAYSDPVRRIGSRAGWRRW